MRRVALVLLAGLPACAVDLLGDYEPGGAADLPLAGAGPFRKLPVDLATPLDEPILIGDRAAELSDPCAVAGQDGGLRLWFGRAPIAGDGSAIATVAFAALGQPALAAPAVVLEADLAWEDGWVGRPSVVGRDGGRLVLYYEGGRAAPAIGRASSSDGGLTWTKDPANPLLVGAGDPSAIRIGDRDLVYVTRPDAPGIHLAEGEDGGPLRLGEPVLLPRPELPDAFDAIALGQPGATAVATLDSDRPVRVALYAAGTRRVGGAEVTSIGWAGSFDGRAFERGGPDAVLDPSAPDEGGPAAILTPTQAVLLFHQLDGGRLAIAAATERPL